MIVAEIMLTSVRHSFGAAVHHRIDYDDLDKAKSEYERVADLMRRREDRKNDLPPDITLEGAATKATVPLGDVTGISLLDYAKANAARSGMRDAYPLLFRT